VFFRRIALILLLGGVGALVALLWSGPIVPSADAAVAGVPSSLVRITTYADAGGGIEVAPTSSEAHTLLILYPGGRVRPHAYTWIGVGLAPVGVRTLIPEMPLDLAVLGRDRATAILNDRFVGERRVLIGGHSLGGAMAASWAKRNEGLLDGLILMGAYPAETDDLTALNVRTLVLAAEQDRLATLTEVRAGLARLPADAGLEILPGAVHAFFGRYGPQAGDGLPSVPRAEAEAEILGALEAFIGSLR